MRRRVGHEPRRDPGGCMRWLPLVVVATACGQASDAGVRFDTASARSPIDPDVHSYVPPDWRASAPVRVVYLGDSITAGAGASEDALAYTALLREDRSSTWSDSADLDLESLYGDLEVIDVSQGGATTGSLLAYQLPALDDALGDSVPGETLVVMTIGGNDVRSALNPLADTQSIVDKVVRNIETAVLDLQGRFPDGAYIYLTNVYEPTDGVGQWGGCFWAMDFSDRLPVLYDGEAELYALGERLGVAVLDLRGHFYGHGFHHRDTQLEVHHPDDPTLWFAGDCIHPNDRGHHEIRRLFHAAIQGVELPLDP